MKTKSILIFCSLIVLVFFQNCNQAGGLNLAEPELQKSSATEPGPLVVDVVDAIEEINNNNNNNNSGSDSSDTSADPVADSGSSDSSDSSGDSSAGTGDSVSAEPPSTIADNSSSSTQQVAQPQPESQPEVVVSQPQPEVVNNVEEVLADNSCGKNGEKVLVCHFPPGNASAKHTICISRRALEAHLSHGHKDEQHQDHVGACVQ